MGLYPLNTGPGGLQRRSGPIGLDRNLSPLPGSNPGNDVIFVCDTVQLFCLVFCVLRAVHIFDFRLAANDTHNKWRLVGIEGLHACCAGQLHSLVQGT